MWFKQSIVLLVIVVNLFQNVICKKRHVLLIIGDDIGYNDCGIHGSSQIPTPNMDALGYNGVTLRRFYTQQSCTPSRTAMLTGNYPIRSGMQGAPITAGEPRSLLMNMPTMAEFFKKLGYNTHLVGKWHLGHENSSVTAIGRGFDTFYGHFNGFMGYKSHYLRDQLYTGYDLHDGVEPDFSTQGIYATDLYTDQANNIIRNHNASNPLFLMVSHLAAHTGEQGVQLETPDLAGALAKYSYISPTQRQIYADVVSRLDSAVGSVVSTLKEKGILEDTIIIYLNDNGSPTVGLFQNSGSNWPFRGIKETVWEGGVRNLGVIWCNDFVNKSYIYEPVFHLVDILPTLYESTGSSVSDLGTIDGVSHWLSLSEGMSPPTRNRGILININEKQSNSAILSRDGRYKLVEGNYELGQYNYYFGDSGRESNTPPYDINAVINSDTNQAISSISNTTLTEGTILNIRNALTINGAGTNQSILGCTYSGDTYCLFDLQSDPTETTDISDVETAILDNLIKELNSFKAELMPQRNKNFDPNSFPGCCSCSWFTWKNSTNPCPVQNNKIYLKCPPFIGNVSLTGQEQCIYASTTVSTLFG